MKSHFVFKLILVLGLIPLIFPFISGFYMASTESWTIIDWLIMYSFVYWPTYIIGAAAVMFSIFMLHRNNT